MKNAVYLHLLAALLSLITTSCYALDIDELEQEFETASIGLPPQTRQPNHQQGCLGSFAQTYRTNQLFRLIQKEPGWHPDWITPAEHMQTVNAQKIRQAKVLIARGVTPISQDEQGKTLLHACFLGDDVDPRMVKLLLDAGVCPDTKDAADKSPLDYVHTAVQALSKEKVEDFILRNKNCWQIAQLLYETCPEQDRTKMEEIKMWTMYGACFFLMSTKRIHAKARKSQLEYFINQGFQVDATNASGQTVLHHAVTRQPDLIQLLLNHGGAELLFKHTHEEQETALHIAARKGNMQAIIMLLCSPHGSSQINGHIETIRRLLTTRNQNGKIPQDIARQKQNPKACTLLDPEKVEQFRPRFVGVRKHPQTLKPVVVTQQVGKQPFARRQTLHSDILDRPNRATAPQKA